MSTEARLTILINKLKRLVKLMRLLLRVARESRCSAKVIGFKSLRGTLGQLRGVASASNYPVVLSNEPLRNTICFVLGNGPSLSGDIKENLGVFRQVDTFCVNNFIESALYEKIQPKYYVLADPGFWSSAVSETYASERKQFFEQILRKTTWPLTVFLPFSAKGMLDGVFSESRNIRVDFYNNVPLSGEQTLVNILYDNNLGMPSPQNVLIPALFLSLRLGYKKIILLGADHSWHQTLALDKENRLCVRHSHFYDQDAELIPFATGQHGTKLFTMDTAFYAFALMFEGYWKIEEYSKHLGAQIYNASSTTFIDAFKRMALSDIPKNFETVCSKDMST